jgi:hypothetical protein
MRNVSPTTEWEEYQQAPGGAQQKIRWEQQTIYADNLGRIRIISKKGTYDPTGSKVPDDQAEIQQAYDGEKTTELYFSPNRDREGTLLRKSDIGKPGSGYRTASIYNGLHPAPRGPAMWRNPLTFMDEAVTSEVRRALEQKSPPSVTANPDGTYHLTYSVTTNEPNRLTYTATLDPKRDWVVKTIRCTGKSGNLLSESQCEYRSLAKDIWVPTEGFHRSWPSTGGKEQAPKLDWRYKVSQIKVNDPSFPRNAFEIVLPDGTIVNDTRYGVQYRVGTKAQLDSSLKKLADTALATEPPRPAPSGAERLAIWILVLANAIAIGTVATLYMVRRARASVASAPLAEQMRQA